MENDVEKLNQELEKQTAELNEILKKVDELIVEIRNLTISTVIVKNDVKELKKRK